MSERALNRQSCPICKRYMQPSSRYRDYVCPKCIHLSTDKEGLLVVFGNTTMDGHGCAGKYIESRKQYYSNKCWIKHVLCYAEEAYFGGIVIRPVL